MNNLSATLDQLHAYRTILATDIETVPARTRPGFEIQRREAQDNIKRLTKEYGDQLFLSSICFCPTGPADKASAFVSVAKGEAPSMIVADVDEMYRTIAQKIWPSMEYQHHFTMDCFSTLVRELRYVAMDLGVSEIMSPRFTQPVTCNSLEELTEYVTQLVREAVGDELNKLYLRNKIVDAAIGEDHSETLPVILTNITADEAKSFSGMFKIFAPVTVTESTEVTPDFVLGVFKKYSKKPKTQAPKAPTPKPQEVKPLTGETENTGIAGEEDTEETDPNTSTK